jgi:transposase
LTASRPDWDPSNTIFAEQEDAMLDSRGQLKHPFADRGHGRQISKILSEHTPIPIPPKLSDTFTDEAAFLKSLEASVKVSSLQLHKPPNIPTTTISSLEVGKPIPTMTPETLAKNFGVSTDIAKRTLQVTTQRGIRRVMHPSVERRFPTNDRSLRYKRLGTTMFTDTLYSNVVSTRKNKCAQIFVTAQGWARTHPIKTESESHEALSLLFQRDGVPDIMVMDGAKAQVRGEFRRKLTEAGVWVKQTEPYSPWQNAAEGGVRELKRSASRKMAAKRSPHVLWDYCAERESYVRSLTALAFTHCKDKYRKQW